MRSPPGSPPPDTKRPGMPRGIERRSIDNQHPIQELLARRGTHGLSACHPLLSSTGTTHIHPTTGTRMIPGAGFFLTPRWIRRATIRGDMVLLLRGMREPSPPGTPTPLEQE